MKKFLIMAMVLGSLQADTFVHITSYHSIDPDIGGEWNNKNYGLGYRFENNLKVGAYRNSDFKTSAYVSYDYFITDYVGVQVGAVTGYDIPVGASLFVEYKHLRLDAFPVLTPKERLGFAIGISMVF